jgi:hypothetical protein
MAKIHDWTTLDAYVVIELEFCRTMCTNPVVKQQAVLQPIYDDYTQENTVPRPNQGLASYIEPSLNGHLCRTDNRPGNTVFPYTFGAASSRSVSHAPRTRANPFKTKSLGPLPGSSTGSCSKSRHAQRSPRMTTLSSWLRGYRMLWKERITISSHFCQSTKFCSAHSAKSQCLPMT